MLHPKGSPQQIEESQNNLADLSDIIEVSVRALPLLTGLRLQG